MKIIDIHTHSGFSVQRIYKGVYPLAQSVQDLVKKMEIFGIDYAVTFPFGATLYNDPRKYLGQKPSGLMDFPYQIENKNLLKEVSQLGKGKILPFVAVNPRKKIKEQIEQIEKLLTEYRIYGFKIHTNFTKSKATDLLNTPFIDLARRNNLPFLFHTDLKNEWANPQHILEIASRYRDLRFVAAHGAGFSKIFFKELKRKKLLNVFFDISPFTHLCREALLNKENRILDLDYAKPKKVLEYLVYNFSDQILFGTDEPFTTHTRSSGDIHYSNIGEEKSLIENLPLKFKEKVAYKNALRFLGQNLNT